MKKNFFYILIFLFSAKFLISQNPTYIENYSIEQGLSQTSVNCIFQSSDGIIWIGTQDGLNEFDGYDFTIFKYNPNDTNSISNNFINDITEDENGNLILATREGVTIWKRKQNKFIRLKNNPQDSQSLSNDNVLKVAYINKTLWALTDNSLDKYLGNGKFKRNYYFKDSSTVRYTYNTLALTSDENNNIWFATKDGINVWHKDIKQFSIFKGVNENLSNLKIRSLYFDNKQKLWVGTYMGLNKLNRRSHSFQKFYYKNRPDYIRENTINDIFIDNNNIFWLGTKSGIKTFDGEKIVEFSNPDLRKIKSQITVIFQDNTNNIWCGTMGAGIYKIVIQKPKFNFFTNFPSKADRMVFSLFVDEKNRIWAGSNGVYIIDKNTKKIIFYDDLINSDTIQEVTVYSFLNEKDKMWLGTDNAIYIIDKSDFQIYSIFDYFDIPIEKKLFSNRIFHINKDNNGIYWIGTYNGLVKFDKKKFTFFKKNKNNKNSISSNVVIKTLIQGDSIFIATYNGLNLYNKKTKKFKQWFVKDGLINNFLLDICQSKFKPNIYWIATVSGLSRFNIINENFRSFTSADYPFPNDFLYTIFQDSLKRLWISSNYGVFTFNPKTKKVVSYDKKDGLPFLESNIGGSFVENNNNIFYSGINGICWTNIYSKQKKVKPLKANINKIIISDPDLNKNIIHFPDTSKKYSFDYKTTIKIFFSVPDYILPERNKFKYKIEGLSDKWSGEQNLNFLIITGLSPGKYTVYIKGANSKGVWNNSPTKFSFEIKPPFSKSFFAKILYLIIVIIFLLVGFLYVYRNIKKENRILQERNYALEQVEKQRKLLEDKNKNITDSINYAKKIIDAILPPVQNLNYILPQSFIYFLPKDIVSGDFYWFAHKNERIFIAAVDCTGHGIPGAFMSIIGINLLERIVDEGTYDPAVILNMMNKEVIATLKKKYEEIHIKDGMDLSLCIIDKTRKSLSFAGAYNPAYIIRDQAIVQFRGNRKSVGNDFEFDSFTSQNIKLRDDDIIYIFSDGYTDQFGGLNRKKFKFRRFRNLLISIHKLPLDIQKQKLHESFLEWKLDYEQIDDILIIGFKPLSFLNK